MSLHQRIQRFLCGTVFLIIVSAVAGHTAGEPTPVRLDVAIIVHKTNPVADLTLDQVRALFNLQTRFWPNNRPVHVVLPGKGLPERSVVLGAIYRADAADLAEKWRQRIFAGEISTVPSGAASPEAIVHAVATDTGAIAAVRISAVSSEVHVVRIAGVGPGDDGYPLR